MESPALTRRVKADGASQRRNICLLHLFCRYQQDRDQYVVAFHLNASREEVEWLDAQGFELVVADGAGQPVRYRADELTIERAYTFPTEQIAQKHQEQLVREFLRTAHQWNQPGTHHGVVVSFLSPVSSE